MHQTYCFSSDFVDKMYRLYILEGSMTPISLFLLPGNLVSDALGVVDLDSRMMLRTLVNMLVWNLVAVLAVLPFI